MYEFHILEPLNEEVNVKKIILVEDATHAVRKKKPTLIYSFYFHKKEIKTDAYHDV